MVGVAGLGSSLRSCYRDIWNNLFHPSDHFSPIFAQFITFLGSSLTFFLANLGGGAISMAIRLKNQPTPINPTQ